MAVFINKSTQINFKLPATDCGNEGKMKWIVYDDLFHAGYIDIWSRNLPETIFRSTSFKNQDTVPVKINYCFRGRCEVLLNSGVTTFVVGDELAIDYGTSQNNEEAFFYPTAEYEGIELILYPSEELGKILSFNGKENIINEITQKCTDRSIPFITVAEERIRRCAEDLKDDILGQTDSNLLLMDIIKLLYLINGMSFKSDKRRTFCTSSQVDIAKEALGIISADLSKRHSAAELAASFGISESSLKNYFRAVFGKGYSEIISEIRMRKAAELIRENKENLGKIAETVGYQNQSRFSEAFLKYHKVLPMEYKRISRC
jgi:AraC-like DNA-binding protein